MLWLLPPELWRMIFDHVDCLDDFRNISLVNRYLHELIEEKLWYRLHLKGNIQPRDLAGLRHRPIRNLKITLIHIRHDLNEWLDVIGQLTELTHLHFERETMDSNRIRRHDVMTIFFALQDFAFTKLVKLTKLKELVVKWLEPGCDAGVRHIVHLPIENLYLENWSAGCVQVAKAVGKMTSLRKLEFNANSECFRYLSNLNSLRELITVNLDRFTLQELIYISHLPLELLDISGCQTRLEDDLFQVLIKMKTLKRLLLYGCRYNPSKAIILKLVNPWCDIEWRKKKFKCVYINSGSVSNISLHMLDAI